MMPDTFKALAERFCAWPLPADVHADACAVSPTGAHPRSGANLLTVAQAEQMLRHVLAGEAHYRAFALEPHDEPDGTLDSLLLVANMLEQYGLAELPANNLGQIDFMRAIMESAVSEIRAFVAKETPTPAADDAHA